MLFISVADGGMISKVLNFGNVKIRNRSKTFCFGLMVKRSLFHRPGNRWQCGGRANVDNDTRSPNFGN